MALAADEPKTPPRLDPTFRAVDDATPRAAPAEDAEAPREAPVERADAPDRRWRVNPLRSPLTRRVLLVNILPLLILVGGLLYLGEYRRGLVETEIEALETQAALIANALGEGTIERAAAGEAAALAIEPARHMVRRLVEPTGARARLFDREGQLVADTRLLSGGGGSIFIQPLPSEGRGGLPGLLDRVYAWVVDLMPSEPLPVYSERAAMSAADYPEVTQALAGEPANGLRRDEAGRLLMFVAVPVQRYREVLAAVMLTMDDTTIEKAIRSVRFDILKVFGVALLATVLLSLFLASTIVRPIQRLALAAQRIQRGQGRPPDIPGKDGRRDEIGDLADSLRTMTEVLWLRLNANERFAADVAHEIKNPLTSLRSAVETAARLRDPEQQRRLMAIIQEDVQRLDRLISDISDASRLDAELSRDATEPVDIPRLLDAFVELHRTSDDPAAPRFRLDIARHQDLTVPGLESRVGQVFRNLIANAISFSPPGGTIWLRAARAGGMVAVQVEDEGPGIPEGKLESIFERFYSERPEGEKFGTHSGLGLSISKQIVEAHGGTIVAENRTSEGRIVGARFVVRLPVGGEPRPRGMRARARRS
ncbi:MAG: stimulus-sensing domain-containing protein [Alphaproteobacteria bacterium]